MHTVLISRVRRRTNLYMKENKAHSSVNFLLTIVYVLIFGVFLSDNSKCVRTCGAQQAESTLFD